jgi:hypothetical protein
MMTMMVPRFAAWPSRSLGVVAIVVVSIVAAPTGLAAAADEKSDSELVAACAKEVRERFFETSASETTVSSSEITRAASEDVVRVALASGEGRIVRATCKFRGGKLFDVLR